MGSEGRETNNGDKGRRGDEEKWRGGRGRRERRDLGERRRKKMDAWMAQDVLNGMYRVNPREEEGKH